MSEHMTHPQYELLACTEHPTTTYSRQEHLSLVEGGAHSSTVNLIGQIECVCVSQMRLQRERECCFSSDTWTSTESCKQICNVVMSCISSTALAWTGVQYIPSIASSSHLRSGIHRCAGHSPTTSSTQWITNTHMRCKAKIEHMITPSSLPSCRTGDTQGP